MYNNNRLIVHIFIYLQPSNISPVLDPLFFEGTEKLLEVWFSTESGEVDEINDLRNISL